MAGSLGQIAGVVTLNIDPFKQSTTALTSMIKATGAALKAQEASIKSFGNSLNGMKNTYSTMQQQMGNLNAKLEQQRATYEKLASTTAKGADEQEKLTRRQANAASAVNRTQAQVSALEGSMGRLSRQIAQQDTKWYSAGKKMQEFGTAATQAGQKMSSIGSTMSTRVTAPIVAGFGYAAKSAIDFNSQIANIGPLLRANGESASQVKSEMSQMANASKQWATQYGVSTRAINSGLEELVKRGYSAKQAMGAMPSILDATKASGEDFNSVMSVSTSTLEQFGLKSNTTAGMLRNTQRVTDSLTYTANATAAGFQDMGDAMTYVGPTAHAAGISLEETASAIGLMSNQGIEGSVAGTALRSALTRLMKPSKQNAQGFKELGINVADFKNHSLTLPEILNKIRDNTQGWTKEQRAAAIATAFGTQAQAGMNALVSEGGDALTELTQKTENATGSTKKIAETMNNTAQAKIERFKESLHVLAINIGDNLLPTIMPLVEDLSKLVVQFGKMDASTQRSIVKWAAFAAAMGPALTVIGGAARGLGALGHAVSAPVMGISRLVGASRNGATVLGSLKAMFSKTAYESGNFATKAGTAGVSVAETGSKIAGSANNYVTFGSKVKTAGSAVLAFASANPLATAAIVAGGAALVAGGVWWEKYGKSAYQASQRVRHWGTDVGAAADKSLKNMSKSTQNANEALGHFGTNISKNSGVISKSFNQMNSEIQKSGKRTNSELTKQIAELDATTDKAAIARLQKQKKHNQDLMNDSKQMTKNVSRMTKQASKEHRKLTDDENQYILNSKKKMNDSEIKLIGVAGKQKLQIEKALNGDISKNSVIENTRAYNQLKSSIKQQVSAYKDKTQKVKSELQKGQINQQTYNARMKSLHNNEKQSILETAAAFVKYGKATGETTSTMKRELKNMGLSYKEVEQYAKQGAESVTTSNSRIADTSSKMGTVARKAGEAWNSMVLDPKTGRIKTNAQQTINETAKTEQGWTQLKFELKHAKLTTNAESMIGVAAVQSGRWDSLPWKDKKAMLRVQKDKDLTNVVKDVKDWDQLSMKEKTAIVRAKGREQLATALIDAGEWNKLPMKDKQALVKSSGIKDLVDMLDKTGTWNDLSVEAKEAVIKGKGNAEVIDQLKNVGKWNDLTTKEKDLIVNDKATRKVVDALMQSGSWNSMTLEQKNAVVQDEATAKIVGALDKSGAWNSLTMDEKDAVVKDHATAKIIQSLTSADKWNGLDMTAKDTIVQDKASAPIVAALVKSGEWNNLPMSQKKAIANTGNSIQDLANLAISYKKFDALPDSKKNLLINDAEARAKLKDAGILVTSYNEKQVNKKTLKAENSDVIGKLKNGEATIVNYNGKEVAIKKLKGNDVDVIGKVESGKASIQSFNDKGVDMKKMLGDPTGVQGASTAGQGAINNFNGAVPDLKHLRGKDQASGPANDARSAVNKFQNLPNLIEKKIRTVYETVKKTLHLEKGDTNFEGGVAMVNDQRGPVFRELIKLPTGEQFVPEGRNVILPLPKHSQVVPAHETNRVLGGIPQFANGTPGYSTVVNELNNLSPTILSPGNSTYNNSTNSNSSSFNNDYSFNINVNASDSGLAHDGERTAKIIQDQIKDIFNKNLSNMGRDVII